MELVSYADITSSRSYARLEHSNIKSAAKDISVTINDMLSKFGSDEYTLLFKIVPKPVKTTSIMDPEMSYLMTKLAPMHPLSYTSNIMRKERKKKMDKDKGKEKSNQAKLSLSKRRDRYRTLKAKRKPLPITGMNSIISINPFDLLSYEIDELEKVADNYEKIIDNKKDFLLAVDKLSDEHLHYPNDEVKNIAKSQRKIALTKVIEQEEKYLDQLMRYINGLSFAMEFEVDEPSDIKVESPDILVPEMSMTKAEKTIELRPVITEEKNPMRIPSHFSMLDKQSINRHMDNSANSILANVAKEFDAFKPIFNQNKHMNPIDQARLITALIISIEGSLTRESSVLIYEYVKKILF